MTRRIFARGPQGSTKLLPVDAALLAKWTDKHGYDGAAKCLGISPTLIHKLSHDGIATAASVQRLTDALHIAERARWINAANELIKTNDK